MRAVLAEFYEPIHRSNLIGMGVLPLQFPEGECASSLGITGEETIDITGVTSLQRGIPQTVRITAGEIRFDAVVRIDTSAGADDRHGGILKNVLRQLLPPLVTSGIRSGTGADVSREDARGIGVAGMGRVQRPAEGGFDISLIHGGLNRFSPRPVRRASAQSTDR